MESKKFEEVNVTGDAETLVSAVVEMIIEHTGSMGAASAIADSVKDSIFYMQLIDRFEESEIDEIDIKH